MQNCWTIISLMKLQQIISHCRIFELHQFDETSGNDKPMQNCRTFISLMNLQQIISQCRIVEPSSSWWTFSRWKVNAELLNLHQFDEPSADDKSMQNCRTFISLMNLQQIISQCRIVEPSSVWWTFSRLLIVTTSS